MFLMTKGNDLIQISPVW